MTKLNALIEKILKIKRKLTASLFRTQASNQIHIRIGSESTKNLFRLRSREKLFEQLRKKYYVRESKPRRMEKWV